MTQKQKGGIIPNIEDIKKNKDGESETENA